MQKDVRSLECMMQSCFCSIWTGKPDTDHKYFPSVKAILPLEAFCFVLPFISNKAEYRAKVFFSLCFDRKHGNRYES